MLEYTLENNELTDKPGDLRVQVINVTSYTQNDIVDRIMNIGAGFTRSDIVSVIEAKKQVIGTIIAEGGGCAFARHGVSGCIAGARALLLAGVEFAART